MSRKGRPRTKEGNTENQRRLNSLPPFPHFALGTIAFIITSVTPWAASAFIVYYGVYSTAKVLAGEQTVVLFEFVTDIVVNKWGYLLIYGSLCGILGGGWYREHRGHQKSKDLLRQSEALLDQLHGGTNSNGSEHENEVNSQEEENDDT